MKGFVFKGTAQQHRQGSEKQKIGIEGVDEGQINTV